ncbi:MAG: chemotaxis-specific protein-glutamate methyltransferase CheB [Deltaproteobacteria bacterium]|nr:chemotaxis-specific protein-glutamate methyltransferase CheB [Deltaproteobacteria bacterium]
MIRLLIAEDSLTVQRVLTHLLSGEPNIEIVGIASDGEEAVRMCKELRPDLMTMDIFMPKLNGLEATRKIMSECPTRIVVISSMVNAPDTKFAFEAMRAGAIDVIEKPVGILSGKYQEIKKELLRIIKSSIKTRPDAQLSWLPSQIADAPWIKPAKPASVPPSEIPKPPDENAPLELICIGGSTGAPTVIVEILSQLPKEYPIPIIVAQHISKGFAEKMADWLNSAISLDVRMASEHTKLRPGLVLVCPDHKHLRFVGKDQIVLSNPTGQGGHIPNIDMLFQTVAEHYGASAVGVILSGMGKDGSSGLLKMRQKQAYTIGQNEETSVVYGMNRVASEIGAVHVERSPIGIANTLVELGEKRHS